jgi:hypothetical protein
VINYVHIPENRAPRHLPRQKYVVNHTAVYYKRIMPFAYYNELAPSQKRVYDRSNNLPEVQLRRPADIHLTVRELHKALAAEDNSAVKKLARQMCHLICEDLQIKPVELNMRMRRPSNSREELMGLYEIEEGETPRISIWVKTAIKGKQVSFKTFLRTILHELCHHLDYYLFDLADSLHTEGFFKRESALYKAVLPLSLQKRARSARITPSPKVPATKKIVKKGREPEQVELF